MAEVLLKVDKTLRYHGHRLACWGRDAWWMLARPQVERPIFVVGCSRAGTTLVYKTFSESAEVGSLQKETHDFWASLHPLDARNWSTHALAASDACEGDRAAVGRYFFRETGRRRFVDKSNQNGLCVPYLHALFPDAHFVYVKRNPGDNIHSLIEGWRRAEQFATWSADLPVSVAVDGGRFTRWCFFLAEGWRDLVDQPIEDVCAFQYRAMNEAILSARIAVPSGQWTEICYEELLQDPVEGFSRAFTSAGLAFDARVRAHCHDVLSRPYNAFSEIRANKWLDGRNASRIQKVLPMVRAVARRMGYSELVG